MREKITFPINVTRVVGINDAGTLAPGLSGDEYQYILHGEKIMWVPPEVHQLITRLNARGGENLAITKQATGAGKDRRITWLVQRVQDEPTAATAPRPAPQPARTARPPQPAAALAADGTEPDWADIHNADPYPEVQLPTAPARPATPQPAPMPATDADALLNALCTAIDVAALAQAHAARRGYPLHFEAGDIRALASGLMIERRDARSYGRRAA